MKRYLIIFVLFMCSVTVLFGQTEELPDTVWTKFTYPNAVNAVKFTPDGKYLASGGDDGVPRLWNAETGELVHEFPNQNFTITDIDIVNNLMAVASPVDGGVFVYDLSNYQILFKLEPSTNVTFSSEGKLLATSRGNTVTTSGISIYNLESGELVKRIDLKRGAYDLKFSKDNQYIVRASHYSDIDDENKEGSIDVFSIPNLNYIANIEKKEYLACNNLSFSFSNEYLAGAISNSPNKVWNTTDWKVFNEFGKEGDSRAIAFSPDSKYVVAGGGLFGKLTTDIYDFTNGKSIYSYNNRYLYSNSDISKTIDINNNMNYIAVGGAFGLYMLNAKWNPTSVQENPVQITEPTVFPNPTNNTANIRFNLIRSMEVIIGIFDINSKEIAEMHNGFLDAGIKDFIWNTSSVPSGTYFAKITANGNISTIKIIVNK